MYRLRAVLASNAIRCGPEALEARLFAPESVPWEDLAFPSDREILRSVMTTGLDRPTSLLAELLWDEHGHIRIRER